MLGLYRDNGKENGHCYIIIGYTVVIGRNEGIDHDIGIRQGLDSLKHQ